MITSLSAPIKPAAFSPEGRAPKTASGRAAHLGINGERQIQFQTFRQHNDGLRATLTFVHRKSDRLRPIPEQSATEATRVADDPLADLVLPDEQARRTNSGSRFDVLMNHRCLLDFRQACRFICGGQAMHRRPRQCGRIPTRNCAESPNPSAITSIAPRRTKSSDGAGGSKALDGRKSASISSRWTRVLGIASRGTLRMENKLRFLTRGKYGSGGGKGSRRIETTPHKAPIKPAGPPCGPDRRSDRPRQALNPSR